MLSIFLTSYISSLYLFSAGLIFFIKKKKLKELHLIVIYGSLVLSFIALFINFFLPLDLNVNTVIFCFFVFFGIVISYKKKILFKLLIISIYISLISTLILSFDNVYRPDASMYHLPYTKIINDSKIIFGVSNLHFRYGHTSILQYLNASFYNHIFGINGILMPASIIFSSIILYFVNQIKRYREKDINYTLFIFLILTYILYGYNRYSEFGNDTIGHLLFLLICSFLVKKKFLENINYKYFNNILILSLFCFTLKTSLILILLVPIYIFLFSFKKQYIFNYSIIFVICFIVFWFVKNIIVSGCLIYPIEITCLEQLKWLSNDLNFNISPKYQSLDNQAWSKGWSNYQGDAISREEYVKNFFWFKTWFSVHGLLIVKKLSVFIFVIITMFYFYRKVDVSKYIEKNKMSNELIFLFLFSILGVMVWFFRFPLFRYGSSYIILFIIIISTITFIKFNLQNKNRIKFKKYINLSLIVFFFLFVSKHGMRIYKNYDYSIWPQFNSEKYLHPDFKTETILINGEIAYYLNKDGFGCGYTNSPCTPYEVKNINLVYLKGYKFYNLIKN